jgi:hypothetical protein
MSVAFGLGALLRGSGYQRLALSLAGRWCKSPDEGYGSAFPAKLTIVKQVLDVHSPGDCHPQAFQFTMTADR